MNTKTLKRLLLLVVTAMLLVTACSGAGAQFPPDLMEAYDRLPEWAPLDLNPCPGTLKNGQTVKIVGYRKILDDNGNPKDPYLNLEYVNSSGERIMTWYTEFANPAEISDCISQKFVEYEYSFFGLWSTWLRTPPTPTPTQEVFSFPTASGAQGSVPSGTSTTSVATPGVSQAPVEIVYYWQKPDGTLVPFDTKEQAEEAVRNSWDGGRILQAFKIAGKQVGDFIEIDSVPSFSAPKDPDGNQVNLSTPTTPYFVNINTGAAFATLEEALANAKMQLGSVEIHSFTRGVDMGLAQSVAGCEPPFGLGPTDKYYGVVMLPAGNTQFYTIAQKSSAERVLLERVGGGTLDVYVRCEKTDVEKTVNPFYPDPSLASLPGYMLTTPYYEVEGVDPINEHLFFLDETKAVNAAENFHSGRTYTGGTVTQKVRDEVQGDPIQIGTWQLPQILPDGFDATSKYFERNGVAYSTSKEAIDADWNSWYFGVKRQGIKSLLRGVELDEPLIVNWWAGWQWFIGLMTFIFAIFRLLRNPVTREALFLLFKALVNVLWAVSILVCFAYIPNALQNPYTYIVVGVSTLLYIMWHILITKLISKRVKNALQKKVMSNTH